MREGSDIPTVNPLSLSELFERYVSTQASRIRLGGLGFEPGCEVELHDAGAAQAVDPRLAWDEATVALQVGKSSVNLPAPSSVPDWRGLVAAQEPALDLAFCAGNFPQMVRNLSLLLQGQAGGADAARGNPFPSTSLVRWTEQLLKKPFPQPLLAVGMLRLAREFDRAEQVLAQVRASAPAEWQAACINEQAALAWHAGRREEAAALWAKADGEYVPSVFNRGLAALFAGKPADALDPLRRAVARLPENGSWHHLARLYLTLAEMRQ